MHSPRSPPQPIDWHPQDWILVIKALCWFASDELITEAAAEDAHRLVDGIVDEQGLAASAGVGQADQSSVSTEP